VISDVHLGTKSCKAEHLLDYLHRIEPSELVLNGDIIDFREFRKGFWPASHSAVIQRILALAGSGVKVSYITGNHDEALRRFSPFLGGNIHLVDNIELTLAGRKTQIVHGDAIEATLTMSRILRRIGCTTYKLCRAVDRHILRRIHPRLSLVRRIKRSRSANKHITRYEQACAQAAVAGGFDVIVTGHIHKPNHRAIPVADRQVTYLNSGDWVDSMTALEHHQGDWRIARVGE
jgi:UDP-2,3-diacylglucosamine pyrophosphatase LpxH